MPKSKKEKDPWEILPEGYTEKVMSFSTQEIQKELAETVYVLLDTKARLKNDPDVCQAQEALEQVAGPYKDDLKAISKKIEFQSLVLSERGVPAK